MAAVGMVTVLVGFLLRLGEERVYYLLQTTVHQLLNFLVSLLCNRHDNLVLEHFCQPNPKETTYFSSIAPVPHAVHLVSVSGFDTCRHFM